MVKRIAQLSFISFILSVLPIIALAHGTEAEHKKELAIQSFFKYGILLSAILTVTGFIIYFISKNRVKKDQKLSLIIRLSKWGSLISLTALIVVGVLAATNPAEKSERVEMMHIHGLGISNDGASIYIPAHDGLVVYQNGRWSRTEGEPHDFMGFSMVNNGFYSSGHPAEGSNLKKPLGIIKTTDMGATFEMLDLYGEVDFHGMAAGYESHTIYALNAQANSSMPEAGLYYSTDEAKSWKKSDMEGISSQISAIAVHPTNSGVVALGTTEGIYFSKNYGQTFQKITDTPATAVTFSKEGNLFAGIVTQQFSLLKVDIKTSEQTEITPPELKGENAISYVAVNPMNEQQLIFSTFEKDIYLTENLGESWLQLAKKGQGINQKD